MSAPHDSRLHELVRECAPPRMLQTRQHYLEDRMASSVSVCANFGVESPLSERLACLQYQVVRLLQSGSQP